ncbi:MAG TPA: UbiD family decarboxylase [Terriglobia bacterium]|nr:UbiD family decarboxylase [Terriglobia bacterium]
MATVMTEQRKKVGYGSLREFLAALEARNLVQHIRVPVDKDWEVGAICREVSDREGPAVLFEKIGEYKTPLLVNTLGTRERYALALGTEPAVEAMAARWRQAYSSPIQYEIVPRSAAPCKEVVIDRPDLFADPFPVPKWHPLDGGYEIGTLHGVISMDPETGWINVGNYRNEIFNSTTMGCYVVEVPYRHIHQHWDKWKARGKNMPVAVVIGPDPYVSLASVSAVPAQVDEYNIAGGLRGAPIEVVKAELSDLLVPAHAEIVIEGEMPIDKFWPTEGPFGEFTGYMGHEVKNSFYIEVKKVTHRRDPIFHGTYEGRPPNESTMVRVISRSAAVLEHLRRAGLVGIRDLCVTPGGCAGFHVTVSIKKSYPGHVRDVMMNIWGIPILFCKHVTVVDEDIDVWNPFMVEWAVATRVQACRDIVCVPGGKSVMLDPSQPGSRRGKSDLLGIDATKPLDEYERDGSEFPPGTDPLPEQMEKVRRRWREYGFPS